MRLLWEPFLCLASPSPLNLLQSLSLPVDRSIPSAMSAPASLRDLYINPSSTWAFTPPTSSQPVKVPEPEPPSSSYQWSTRPSHNSIFDLSPSLDLNEPSTINASDLLKTLVASAVLQYTSTAIAMPWEVGKLLLQVQWVPRHPGEPEEPEYVEEPDDAVGSLYPQIHALLY
jgi:fusion and transport protein UGO1